MKNDYLYSVFISRLYLHTIQKQKQKYIVIFIVLYRSDVLISKIIFLKKYYFNILIN